jgi:hypothetical protein
MYDLKNESREKYLAAHVQTFVKAVTNGVYF